MLWIFCFKLTCISFFDYWNLSKFAWSGLIEVLKLTQKPNCLMKKTVFGIGFVVKTRLNTKNTDLSKKWVPFAFHTYCHFIFQKKTYFIIIIKTAECLPASVLPQLTVTLIDSIYAKSLFHKYFLTHRQLPLFSNWQANTFAIDIDHIANRQNIFKKLLNPFKIN